MVSQKSKSLIAGVILAAVSGMASAGPLHLKVVYPVDNQNLPAVDSNFIFGSVEPGSSLRINDENVKVHRDGGWLAFLPVTPGNFKFVLHADKGKASDSAIINLHLPELPQYNYDSLYISNASTEPSHSIEVLEGDMVDIGFSGTPYCNAFCVLLPMGDTIPIQEAPARGYYTQKSIFDRDAKLALASVPESLLIRGTYRGTLQIPHCQTDTLRLVYHIYPPSNDQIEWYAKHAIGKAGMIPAEKLKRLKMIKSESSQVVIVVRHDISPTVIEFKDSITVIRTGPGKGYQCLFQPAGIRAAFAGRDGNWIRIKMAENQFGWVPDTAVTILMPGASLPHSYVKQISTAGYTDHATVTIGTTARHPFRIEEDVAAKTLTVILFGVDGDTDWIRYDSQDSLVSRIEWSQVQFGVYRVVIYLTAGSIWGYDAYYKGNDFNLDIKRYPAGKPRLADCRIVVDPGHSPDPGASGPTGLKEKDANLDIAKQLKRELEREGADVVLTRSDDSPLPLYDRPKIAAREKADLFISIHNNALPDGINPFANNGVSTYYYQPRSAALAHSVQKSLAAELNMNDFGWYYSNLAVDRPTQYPAILVECAFMMIPEQEALLRTEKFQKKVAKAIADGVREFFKNQAMGGER